MCLVQDLLGPEMCHMTCGAYLVMCQALLLLFPDLENNGDTSPAIPKLYPSFMAAFLGSFVQDLVRFLHGLRWQCSKRTKEAIGDIPQYPCEFATQFGNHCASSLFSSSILSLEFHPFSYE